MAEIVAHVDSNVGQVETAVSGVVLVFLWKLVAVEMVAVEIAAGDSLAVGTKSEMLLSY